MTAIIKTFERKLPNVPLQVTTTRSASCALLLAKWLQRWLTWIRRSKRVERQRYDGWEVTQQGNKQWRKLHVVVVEKGTHGSVNLQNRRRKKTRNYRFRYDFPTFKLRSRMVWVSKKRYCKVGQSTTEDWSVLAEEMMLVQQKRPESWKSRIVPPVPSTIWPRQLEFICMCGVSYSFSSLFSTL